MRKRTYACGFGGNFQLSFLLEKATVFLVLVLPAPFLGTPAVAKSADEIARSLNVSDLDPLRTPSEITSRTAACATRGSWLY